VVACPSEKLDRNILQLKAKFSKSGERSPKFTAEYTSLLIKEVEEIRDTLSIKGEL